MHKIFLYSTLLFLLGFVACTKHKEDVEDTTPQATIQFLSPAQAGTYSNNDSVAIQAKAISTATIHGYDIIIRKAEDTSQLYFTHIHDHNDTLQVNSKWRPTVSSANLQVELVLYLDHEGHTGRKKVTFSVK